MTDVKIRNKPLFQAMVEGIQQEMERDPRVICMGEDVGKMGGVFQSTAGLHKKFPAASSTRRSPKRPSWVQHWAQPPRACGRSPN